MAIDLRKNPTKINRVLYYLRTEKKVVRVVVNGLEKSTVRHHQSGHWIVNNSDLGIASREEIQAYLAPVVK